MALVRFDGVLTYHDLPREFNLTTYFLDRNLEQGRADSVALIEAGRRYTYRDVAELTNRVGHVLLSLGVQMEQRVLLALSDGALFVASWYGVIKIGAVVAEVYTFLGAKDFLYYLNYSRARAIVVDDTCLDKVRAVAGQCPHLQHILTVGHPGELRPNEIRLEDHIRAAPAALAPARTTKDDIALWKFTTGSTGAPKAAVHCQHDPVLSFAGYARSVLDLSAADRILAVPKLFFGYARDLVSLFAFGVGACGIVFPERSTPERLFRLIERHRPTILVNVPTMMNAMLGHPESSRADMSSLRLNISAGEALPPAVARAWFDAFGVETLDGIGSAEAYHIYISARPGAPPRPGSVGQLVPGYTAQIKDPDGNPLPDGEIGELWLTGESSALMYWNEHEKSKHTFHGDTIRSGDLFRRDVDGYFWFQGRADDLLKVGGMWVLPLEIEACLLEHPAVFECAVIGVEVEGLTIPRAYVVLEPGASATTTELQQFVKGALAPHKYPREVYIRRDLPRTASGKIDRRALVDHAS